MDDHELSRTAASYLWNRQLNPEYLQNYYGWRVCVEADRSVLGGGTQGRIIIPVTLDGQEIGWQARLSHDPPPHLKDKGFQNLRWLTMPGSGWRRRSFLGLDQARSSKWAVLVEGPTDLARHGPPFVASMGMSLSSGQYDLLSDTWGGQGNVLFILQDAGENENRATERHLEALRDRSRGGLLLAPRLPHGDPGSWDHNEMLEFLNLELRNLLDGTPGPEKGQRHGKAIQDPERVRNRFG